MEKERVSSLLSKFTSSSIAAEFNTFSKGQILDAKQVLSDSANSKILDFADFLLNDYQYENLKLEDEAKRELFAFGMAQCWIFTRTNYNDPRNFSFLNCFASPLAAILDTDYQLSIDEVEIIEKLTGKRAGDLLSPSVSKTPINYEKRLEYWDFLNQLSSASVCELKTLVLVANAMSTQTHLLEFSRISDDKCVDRGIDLLNKSGFVELDVPKANLLAIFPLKQIKKFAKENGVKKIPSRKDDLIKLIKVQCEPTSVAKFVKSLLNDRQYGYGYSKEKFILPTFAKAKPFQSYIRSELDRLSLYLEYIGCVEYQNRTVISPVQKRTQPGNRPGDNFKYLSSTDDTEAAIYSEQFIEAIKSSDLKKIQRYWDSNCDNLLIKVVDESSDEFPVGVLVSKIMSYWDKSRVVSNHKTVTRSLSYEEHWYWLVNSYVSHMLAKEKNNRSPFKEQVCNGCGVQFEVWTVSLHSALKVEHKIQFCDKCYDYIFDHHYMANTTDAFNTNPNDMLQSLFELSRTLEFIPTRQYMEKIVLPLQPAEKQIAAGKILLRMPAYDIYIEKIGSWLECLSLSGVLDDGHRKTSRGIQCLANDGHVCLSLGEKAVDDWLSSHNISHEKEEFYPYDEILNPNERSRTDWKIGNIYIEYAGMMDDMEYAAKMKRKKELAHKNNIHLIIVEPHDLFSLDKKLSAVIQ